MYTISTSNHMLGRTKWYKLPECIFENFENCPSKTRAISKFSKIARVIYLKSFPKQTSDYWLIKPNQQTLCIETNINILKLILTAGNYKITLLMVQC